MKKYTLLVIIFAIMALVLPPFITRAEEVDDEDITPSTQQNTIKDRIRANNERRIQNIKNNNDDRRELRNERRSISSTTREDIRDIRKEGREDIRNASSTEDRKDIRREMRLDILKTRQEGIVKQMTLSIENLKQIRNRIATRIDKIASSSKDVTEPKKLLVEADKKIANAEVSLKLFSDYQFTAPNASTTNASSTSMGRPVKLSQDTHKAIQDAKHALQKVVVSLLKLSPATNRAGDNTSSSTSTTTNQ
jgi:hypothetical protein